MSTIEVSNNRSAITALFCASYVALESYFLYLTIGSIIPRFWLSNAVLHLFSVFASYFIMSAIVRRTGDSKRKKIVLGIGILAVTIIAAIGLTVISTYLNKLHLQSTFN